ncbi:protein kinase family protein [Pelagicoccus albus]|uniref:Protein kinase n=1 Tax=Pelagicoccus albus TaxID=415222 RepID=A0A7X1BAL1_9BACT|nr:protein kinase family protein [Pelagicoccus albus]MBC2607483.1 protein kinase [Pelagicoccus albus]
MPHPLGDSPEIPDYILLRKIGSGSYGDVYLARGVTGLFRAVKVVYKSRFPDSVPFEREMRGLEKFARISLIETSQLAVLHIGKSNDGSYFYYVMELADDIVKRQEIEPENYKPLTLREHSEKKQTLAINDCLRIGIQLATALKSLHRYGLVHRDIKPSNIVYVNGIPKLADIGLVAQSSQELSIVGTEGYLAPEGPGSPQADLFALGKVLYEIATGLDRKRFPMLPDKLSSHPEQSLLLEFNEVLLKTCDPRMEKRYADAADLLDALHLIQAGKSLRRLNFAEKSLKTAAKWITLLAVVATIAVSGAFLERRRANASEKLLQYAAALTQARSSIAQGDLGFARNRLRLGKELRKASSDGFEWRALNMLAQGTGSTLFRPKGPRIMKLDSTSDGQLFAVHDYSTDVNVYSTETLEQIATISGVSELGGITPSGSHMFGANLSGRATLWSIEAEPIISIICDDEGRFRPLGIDHSETCFGLIDGQSNKLVRIRPKHRPQILNLALPNQDTAQWQLFRSAVSTKGETIIAWVSLVEATPKFLVTHADSKFSASSQYLPDRPHSVGFDETGPWICLAEEGTLLRKSNEKQFEPDKSSPFPALTSHRVILPDGAEIIVHAEKATFRHSDKNTILAGHASDITSVTSTGTVFITGSEDGEIRIWPLNNIEQKQARFQAWNAHGKYELLAFTHDGRIAVRSGEKECAILNSDTLALETTKPGVFDFLEKADGTEIALSSDGIVLLEDTKSGEGSIIQEGAFLRVFSSPNNRADFAISSKGSLYRIKGNQVTKLNLPFDWSSIVSIETEDSGSFVWAVDSFRTLSLWDLNLNSQRWAIDLGALSPEIVYNAVDDTLYILLSNGQVQHRDAQTGDLLAEQSTGSPSPECLVISPLENRLLVGGREGLIHVLSLDQLAYLAALPVTDSLPVHTIALNKDVTRLAILGKSGPVRVIKADY